MKPLKVILLGAAISFASQAHSQAELTGLLATVPLGSLSLSPTGGAGLTALPSGLLGGIVPSILDLTNQALPLVSGLLSNDLVGGLTPLTSDLLGSLLSGALPLTLQTVDVVLPLVDGLTASGIPLPTASLLGGLTPVVLDLTNTAVIPLLGGVVAGGII